MADQETLLTRCALSTDWLRDKGEVHTCAFSPDGLQLAAAVSWSSGGGVYFADVIQTASSGLHVLGFISAGDSSPRDVRVSCDEHLSFQ
eukprot:gene9842-biopygen7685